MNICIFGNSFLPAVGGKEYVMHNLANALVDRGHDVVLIAKRVSWHTPSEVRSYQLKRYSVPIRGSGSSGLDLLTAIFVVMFQNLEKKIDVLNCHGVDYSGTMARQIKSMFKIPLVMTPHGADIQKIPDIGYGVRLNKKWDLAIRKNLGAADYVTAISQSVHNDLDSVPEERIIDKPNGIHVDRFAGPESSYLRRKLDIPATSKIILSVGRNHIKKGYDYGIRAVARLVREFAYKDLHYVIVGRDVKTHRKLVKECRAESFVTLIDEMPSENITQCYKSADIFFSPSIVEGLSLVSIEAMASGLPLIVTNVPGNDDVVKDNGCGIIVKNQDVDSMAQGILQLLEDADMRLSLSDLSKKCSLRYDWSHIARMYEEVYRRAVTNEIRWPK